MNNNKKINWPPSSIDDITAQCESLSLSSSETDNITLDSGIFFDNKSDSKIENSPTDGVLAYCMLNAASSKPPPPPPYNSTHNIISKILETSEANLSFQATTTVNIIPYYNDSICSNLYSSVTKPKLDAAYLNDNSLPHTSSMSRVNSNVIPQRFVKGDDLPDVNDNVFHHVQNTENNKVADNIFSPALPQIPFRQKTSCPHYNFDTQLIDNKFRTSLPSNIFNVDEQIKRSKRLIVESNEDSKALGICNKCRCTVSDSESACIALGKFYHSVCFVCSYCNQSLRGKVFYKIQDNVYCEYDYMVFGFHKSTKTCIACGHIITESILEALGNAFHPQCFKCSVCLKCLDGIPFTVDKNNKIYCIPDYHLTFAPRCAICFQSIIPCNDSDDVVRVVVNDRDFHVDCYRCQNCLKPLANDSNCFVWTTNRSPANVKLLCRKCYGDKFREITRYKLQ